MVTREGPQRRLRYVCPYKYVCQMYVWLLACFRDIHKVCAAQLATRLVAPGLHPCTTACVSRLFHL